MDKNFLNTLERDMPYLFGIAYRIFLTRTEPGTPYEVLENACKKAYATYNSKGVFYISDIYKYFGVDPDEPECRGYMKPTDWEWIDNLRRYNNV